MKNEKGFTLVELLAAMAILGILSGLAIQAYTKYRLQTIKFAYDTLAESSSDAATNYELEHMGTTEVTLQELYDGGYLENIKDPGKKDNKCSGRVKINKVKSQKSNDLDYNYYEVSICCKNYNYTYTFPGKKKVEDEFCRANDYDITKIKEVKVLNVYPNSSYANYFKNWMNTYGKGIIKVTPVYIGDFNNNPTAYLGTEGEWRYDVIVFGFADCNSSKDLTAKSAKTVDKFLSSGGAALFGHDTITKGCGNHVNFISLQDYVKVTATSDLAWNGSNQVKIIKKGIFTEYPYNIGNVNTTLTIPTTHNYGQIANGEIWLTFGGISNLEKNVYLTTYGSNALIQTGHSNGSATADEQKILANIVFYMKARQYV